jgi:hypothetical protein
VAIFLLNSYKMKNVPQEGTSSLTEHYIAPGNTLAQHYTPERSIRTVPSLPAELWLVILELAIRPSIILDLKFDPCQIELAYKCLVWDSHGNQSAAEKMARKAGRPLRAVCSLWKRIIDQIYLFMSWIVGETGCWPDAPYEFTITDTKKCIRLNRMITGCGPSPVKVQCSHPIPTLSLFVYGNNQGHVESLEDIAPFPTELNVLSLRLNNVCVPANILKEIQVNLVALTTLQLYLHTNIITECLEFPDVITLFLSIIHIEGVPENLEVSEIRWKFPKIQNLALTDYIRETWDRVEAYVEINPFFFVLLQDHIDSIQSLRIEPTVKEIVDVESPICWLKMKKLSALAANFCQPVFRAIPGEERVYRWKSSSVRHLIQIALNIGGDDRGDKIRYFIESCPYLETLSLSIPRSNNQNIHKVASNSHVIFSSKSFY